MKAVKSLLGCYRGMAGTDKCLEEIAISCVSVSPDTRTQKAIRGYCHVSCIATRMEERTDKQVAAGTGVRLS